MLVIVLPDIGTNFLNIKHRISIKNYVYTMILNKFTMSVPHNYKLYFLSFFYRFKIILNVIITV